MKADFDIGNLVYVILTIVFLIFGVMGKKKKPVRQVIQEAEDTDLDSVNIKSQFQELFREFNPVPEVQKEEEYSFSPGNTVEEGPALDVVPEENYEYIVDTIPLSTSKPLDSNINYNDQAKSSLDTTGMDEGVPAFDYEMDHSSQIYNSVTKEYSSQLSGEEEEMALLVEEFDPRTAFVYSEIFNRKDF